MSQVRVLVVDDSAFMRKAITSMLESDPDVKVVGTAGDGQECLEKTRALKPDIVTLDIEMPRMDGLTSLRHIMKDFPTPVLMLSSVSTEGAEATLDALSLGAVDFIPKQFSNSALDIVDLQDQLVLKIKQIVKNQGRIMAISNQQKKQPAKNSIVNYPIPSAKCLKKSCKRYSIVSMGTSTGGPPALQEIIHKLPAKFPVPIVIVQHMPPMFTNSLAKRLDSLSILDVKEAEHGEPLLSGHIYIAPGNMHLKVSRVRDTIQTLLTTKPDNVLHKPSVDILFKSVVDTYGSNTLGIILTGMGSDGLKGARAVRQSDGSVFAQNEQTCVVYGMPKSVVENDLADKIVPIQNMAAEIVSCF